MKTFFYILMVTIALSSCSGNKFLNRKYTSGLFKELDRNMKHNTTKVANKNAYASSISNIELEKTALLEESLSEKEIIELKVNSITKKDSIIHILKKGRDEIIVIKNDLPNVYVKVNPKTNKKTVTHQIDKINSSTIGKETIERDLRIRTIVGLIIFFVPIVGILIAIQTKKRIKKYKQQNPNINYSRYKKLANLGLALSILPSLAMCLAVLAFAALILALCFSASGFFTIALF